MHIRNLSELAPNCNTHSQSEITLSAHQKAALDSITTQLRRSNKQFVYLAGLAGTGKTELVTRIGRILPDVQYAAFTGKAASVLQRRGADNAITIHSLLYGHPHQVTTRAGQNKLLWRRRSERITASLIVADECSMIDGTLARHLIATGIPVLVTGDQMQLPPVSGKAFFTKPDFTLTEIHRQAAGSQPLQLATAIRQGRHIKPQVYDINRIIEADVAIVAFEKTRRDINRRVRRALGIKGHDPVVGDTVCCFKSNTNTGVLNGTLWTVQSVITFTDKRGDLVRMELVDEIGSSATVRVLEDLFHGADPRDKRFHDDQSLDLFSFGYTLTCHKAQGSEWDTVVVIDETASPGFDRITGDLSLTEFTKRWLYTAVTRAKLHVVLMEPPQ